MYAPRDVRVVYSDEGAAFVVGRQVMVGYFRREATLLRMRGFRATQRELARQPDPVACLLVSEVHPDLELALPEPVREEIREALTAYNHRDLAVAASVEGGGLLAAAARTMISGLMLVAGPRYPMKLFGAREPAATWLAQRIGPRCAPVVTADDVLTLATQARAALR